MKVTSKDKNGNVVELYVRKPTSKDTYDAKAYSNGIASKIMLRKDDAGNPNFITRAQVRQLLRDTGKISKEEEENILKISEEIKELTAKLVKGGIKKTEGRELAIDLRIKRQLLFNAYFKINELDEYTLESQVDNANFDFLVARCTLNAEQKSVFNSIEDYKDKADSEPYAFDAANALKELIFGTAEDMVKDNIENKFLRKYGFVDDKLRLINKDGKLVDREGNLINEDGEFVDAENKVITQPEPEVGEFLDEEVVVQKEE